jgi:hypothetical protein
MVELSVLNLRPVVVSERGERCVARESIRDYSRTVSHIATNECCERGLRGGRNDAKTDAPRSFAADLNCPDDKHFASGASAAFARTRSSHETLVHLNRTSDPIPSGPQHSPAQSMQHSPSCLVGAHAKLSLQLDRRQTRRHCADQMGSMEPQLKRYASTMQDCPGRRRRLPTASLALQQPPLREGVCLDAPTVRTRESIGPPRLRQITGAWLFVWKQRVKFHDSARTIGTRHMNHATSSSLRCNPIGMIRKGGGNYPAAERESAWVR